MQQVTYPNSPHRQEIIEKYNETVKDDRLKIKDRERGSCRYSRFILAPRAANRDSMSW